MADSTASLHLPLELGALQLRNRFIMAPMTRLRVDDAHLPLPFVADYYRQRAGAGLIVSEGLAAGPHGAGYPVMPVLRSADQIHAWRRITDMVHDAGGVISAQLWHVGHAREEDKGNERPPFWALSDPVMPEALSRDEITAMSRDFREAAQAALDAGFDALEIHSGNGMLLDRFLRANLNRREDGYGGDVSGRIRLTMEVIEAVLKVFPANKVGIKFEPNARTDADDGGTDAETFRALFAALQPLGLAYLHLVRHVEGVSPQRPNMMSLEWLRSQYAGAIIAGGGFDLREAEQLINTGTAEAIVFGKLFLANPDLPDRHQRDAVLNEADPTTFYTSGPDGLVDYAFLED